MYNNLFRDTHMYVCNISEGHHSLLNQTNPSVASMVASMIDACIGPMATYYYYYCYHHFI